MSDLIVLTFENEAYAFQMRDKLLEMQKKMVISLADAAIVVRNDNGKPKIKQLHSLVGTGAMGGAFWGMFIGLLFLNPWLGMAVGALSGALGGAMSDYGVDDNFIKEVGSTIQPGQAALFLLVTKYIADKVLPELGAFNAKVLQTSLTDEAEAKLRNAFGAEDMKETC